MVQGRLYINDELMYVALGISDGKIAEIKKVLTGDRVIDYGDRIILPGAIDPHVHLRDPGECHKEDFSTGTMAAAIAGVTCVFDMPNNKPPVNDLEGLREKDDIAKKKSCVDYGLFTALYKLPPTEIGDILSLSVGLKLYLAKTTGEIYLINKEEIEKEIKKLVEYAEVNPHDHIVITVHCEDYRTIEKRMKEYGNLIKTLEDYNHVRDIGGEASSAARFIDIAAPYIRRHENIRINVAHVSSLKVINAVKMVVNNWHLGNMVSFEVTPHHIYLNERYCHPIHKSPGFGKVNPPLRDIDSQRTIWDAIAQGKIDMFATDHAPHTIDEKDVSFEEAPAGMPGLQSFMPMLLYLLKKQNISLERLINMYSIKTAEVFGLMAKGHLDVGFDADFMVVDFTHLNDIKERDIVSKCGWTPYEGFQAIFPQDVYLRGERIVHNWEFCGECGLGINVKSHHSRI